ncbi:hypothetical protein V8C42DRAFT_308320 [Trichoderma barbatum]
MLPREGKHVIAEVVSQYGEARRRWRPQRLAKRSWRRNYAFPIFPLPSLPLPLPSGSALTPLRRQKRGIKTRNANILVQHGERASKLTGGKWMDGWWIHHGLGEGSGTKHPRAQNLSVG